jgi:hypothetical protein
MKEKLALKMAALTKKAKENGKKISSGRHRSSLHRVIKTREQANAFMKLLQSA